MCRGRQRNCEAVARVVVEACHLLMSPYVINDVLGAFTTTFEVIPAAQRCLRPSLPRRAAKPQSRHLLFPATFPAPPE